MRVDRSNEPHNVRIYWFGTENFCTMVNYAEAPTQGLRREKQRAMSQMTNRQPGVFTEQDRQADSSINAWFYLTDEDNIEEHFLGEFDTREEAVAFARQIEDQTEAEGFNNIRRRWMSDGSIYLSAKTTRHILGSGWKKTWSPTKDQFYEKVDMWFEAAQLPVARLADIRRQLYREALIQGKLKTRLDVFERGVALANEEHDDPTQLQTA